MFFSGQKLGNYTLVSPLGRGSFGDVWLATRETKFVTTKVAIKLPNREQVEVEAIKQEAILWEQASGHPNVLPIIEADEYDGQIVIVSEYAADGTLGDVLDKKGFLPVKKAVEMAIGILNGLEFLHSRQIIHRDIKPANILLQGEIPRLTDFGMSRAISSNSLSMSISINGTPYYMSPEAFNRKRNKQTDIWSFGVVLYKMLTGQLPFEGNDVGELYTSVFTQKPPPMSSHIPPFLQQIVLKTLAKSPAERYAETAQIREDLTRCLANLSAQNIQPNFPKAQSNESFITPTAESFSLASQTADNPIFNHTKNQSSKSISFSKPKRKFFNFKYLSIVCVLLLTIFAAGFYVVSNRQPIPFRKGDKFGYSTWHKEIVIGAKYDRAFQFSNDLALVALGQKDAAGNFVGKHGFIDKRGREVIPLDFDSAESFSGNLAKVGKFDNSAQKMLFGFINSKGEEVIATIYEDAKSFSENLAAVKSKGKWGAIDEKGNPMIPFKYDWIDDFSDSLAAVRIGDKYGFINKSGEEILPSVYDLAGKFSGDNAPVKKDGKAFFIDKKGKQILPFKYDTADSFSEGLALVRLNGKSGFIEKLGGEVIAFQYENEKARFSEGLVSVKLNGKYGFINGGGKVIVPFKYAEAEPLWNNLARAKTEDGKEFYIGFDGTEFYEP